MPSENDDDFEDSKGSDVEILEGGSDVDIYEETKLMKFSRMLQGQQAKNLQWALAVNWILLETPSKQSLCPGISICSCILISSSAGE